MHLQASANFTRRFIAFLPLLLQFLKVFWYLSAMIQAQNGLVLLMARCP